MGEKNRAAASLPVRRDRQKEKRDDRKGRGRDRSRGRGPRHTHAGAHNRGAPLRRRKSREPPLPLLRGNAVLPGSGGRMVPGKVRSLSRPLKPGRGAHRLEGGNSTRAARVSGPRRRGPGSRPRLSRLSRLDDLRRRSSPRDAPSRGKRFSARPRFDSRRRGREGLSHVHKLSEQPHDGSRERELLRGGGGLRPEKRRSRLPRRRVHRDSVRRKKPSQLSRDPGRHGGGTGVPLPLQDLQHDRVARGVRRRKRKGPSRVWGR